MVDVLGLTEGRPAQPAVTVYKFALSIASYGLGKSKP